MSNDSPVPSLFRVGSSVNSLSSTLSAMLLLSDLLCPEPAKHSCRLRAIAHSSTHTVPAAAALSRGASLRPPRHRQASRLEAGPGGLPTEDDDLSFEPRRKQRYAAKVKPKVQVLTPIVDSAMGTGGAAPPETAEAETRYLLGLTAVFAAILLEGLLVAGSGFMAEEYDQLVQVRRSASIPSRTPEELPSHTRAQDRVLPIFGPTVLLFLAGSSAYGVSSLPRLAGHSHKRGTLSQAARRSLESLQQAEVKRACARALSIHSWTTDA